MLSEFYVKDENIWSHEDTMQTQYIMHIMHTSFHCWFITKQKLLNKYILTFYFDPVQPRKSFFSDVSNYLSAYFCLVFPQPPFPRDNRRSIKT